MARGGQRCHCFSRNASFIRTVFCEYTLYFFCCFFCDFLLFLSILSPFFGILAGRQRAPEVAGRMHAGPSVFGAALAACACDLGSLVSATILESGGFGECSAHLAQPRDVFLCPRTGCGTGDPPSLVFICNARCTGAGRATMAQNSPGPGLRAINGPEFDSRAGKVAAAGSMSVPQNRFCRQN